MPESVHGHFAVLSLIVAPAILTNACALLAMSTSNRLARAVDHARDLAHDLDGAGGSADERRVRTWRELVVTADRAVLLLRALRAFYSALGGFTTVALLAIMGAVASRNAVETATSVLERLAIAAGAVAVAALAYGSVLLLRETGLAVDVLRDQAHRVQTQRGAAGPGGSPSVSPE